MVAGLAQDIKTFLCQRHRVCTMSDYKVMVTPLLAIVVFWAFAMSCMLVAKGLMCCGKICIRTFARPPVRAPGMADLEAGERAKAE